MIVVPEELSEEDGRNVPREAQYVLNVRRRMRTEI